VDKVIQFFIEQFEQGINKELPLDIIEELKSIDRAQRGELKVCLLNEAKQLASKDASLKAITWLESTYFLIEKHAFRYHKVLFSPGHDIPEALSLLLDSAKTSIDLCVFTISDERLAGKITDAFRRGIKVRIISDDQKIFDEGSQVKSLHAAGLPVKVDHSRYHMHNKFGVIDSRITFSGSYNWTYTAREHNQENLVVTTNYDIVHQFNNEFNKLWEQMFDI
jgi:cardiolipin hydrolase